MIKNSSLILRLVPKGIARKTLNNQFSTDKIILKANAGATDPIQQLYADKVNSFRINKKFPICSNMIKTYEKNYLQNIFLLLFR